MVKDHWPNTCASWHNTSHLMASRVCSSVFSSIIYFLMCLSVRQFVEINIRSLLIYYWRKKRTGVQSGFLFFVFSECSVFMNKRQIRLLKTLQWLHIHIHSSSIYWYNGQGGESTQVTTNKQMNKMWSIHTHDCYSTLARKKILTHATTRMNLRHYTKWNKPTTKRQTLDDPTYMKYLKQ